MKYHIIILTLLFLAFIDLYSQENSCEGKDFGRSEWQDSLVSFQEENQSLSIITSIYPNPTSNLVKVKMNFEDYKKFIKLSLINENGELVKEIGVYSNISPNLEIQFLLNEPSGIYFLQVNDGKKIYMKKFINQR